MLPLTAAAPAKMPAAWLHHLGRLSQHGRHPALRVEPGRRGHLDDRFLAGQRKRHRDRLGPVRCDAGAGAIERVKPQRGLLAWT
jgi:hypothetical protein